MTIPAQRYFRILIGGAERATVAEIIERERNFRTRVIQPPATAGTISSARGRIAAARATRHRHTRLSRTASES